MANNDKITVEIKSDFSELKKQIEDFSKKVNEIYQIFDSTLSKPISTFDKLKSSLKSTAGNIEKINEVAKQGSKAIEFFGTGLKNATDSGLKGYKKLESAIGFVTDKTGLATAASKAFTSIFSFGGIAMITAGIIGLTIAFVEMAETETKSVKAAKENLQAMKQQKEQFKEMQQESKKTLETSMVQIDLTQRYSKELLSLVDANGIVTGSQERVNFLIEQLNKLLPDAGFCFDEETGKIVNLNGEAINLTDTLEDLIQAQKAQAYLDAYQDDYNEALKNKNDLMKKQVALYEEINKKQSIADQFTERAAEAREKFGYGTQEYNNYMEEFYKSVGMSAEEMKPLFDELEILNQEYAEGQATLKGYTDQINDFETMQEAIVNKDWNTVKNIMNNIGEIQLFDPAKGKDQIDVLQKQYDELNNTKQVLEEMKANGDVIDEEYLERITEQTKEAQEQLVEAKKIMNDIGEIQLFDPKGGKDQIDVLQIQYDELNKTKQMFEEMRANGYVIDDEYLQNITEQTKKAQEELVEAEKYFNDKRHSYFSEEVNLMGDDFKESLAEKTLEAGEGMVNQLVTDAKTAIESVNTEITSAQITPLIIPVKYQYDDTLMTSLGATASMKGASYDDSLEDTSMFQPFSNGTSSFMAQARNTIQSIQSKISKGLVSMPVFEAKLVDAGSNRVDVNQTNIFNVPVQKPSDVTKAIEKQNRELAKKL